MKKILIFSESFEPAYKGGGVAQSLANLVKNVGNIFQFYVVTLNHEYRNPAEKLEGIVTNSWIDFEGKGKVIYLSKDRINYTNFKTIIEATAPTIIYLNGLYELYFVALPIYIAKRRNIQIVVAPRGLLHKGALNLKPLKKKAYLELFKLLNLHKQIRWHSTDEQEVVDVKRMFGDKAETVLAKDTPDVKHYPIKPIKKEINALKLVTISLVAPKKNYIRTIEALDKLGFSIDYDIYGPIYNNEYWNECQKRINKLPKNIKVNYQGAIKPQAVPETLSKYHFFILPTLGENFGHAIFESFNVARPVIISDKTPWKNLEVNQAGFDFSLNEVDGLEKAITKAYLMNQEAFELLSQGAYKLAKNFVIESEFEEQYKKLFS